MGTERLRWEKQRLCTCSQSERRQPASGQRLNVSCSVSVVKFRYKASDLETQVLPPGSAVHIRSQLSQGPTFKECSDPWTVGSTQKAMGVSISSFDNTLKVCPYVCVTQRILWPSFHGFTSLWSNLMGGNYYQWEKCSEQGFTSLAITTDPMGVDLNSTLKFFETLPLVYFGCNGSLLREKVKTGSV